MSMELGLDHAPATETWNDSLTGDYLWSNANLGEAVPDVMTPCAWSLLRVLAEETAGLPSIGGYPLMGNTGVCCLRCCRRSCASYGACGSISSGRPPSSPLPRRTAMRGGLRQRHHAPAHWRSHPRQRRAGHGRGAASCRYSVR